MKDQHYYLNESLRYAAQSISCCLGAVGTWWGVAAMMANGSGDLPVLLGVIAATLTIFTVRYALAAVDNKIAAEREEYWRSRSSTKETRI